MKTVHRTSGRQGEAALLGVWLPSLDGVVERLDRGARVVDVGCGRGEAAIAMARAFPASTFLALDSEVENVKVARLRAREAGVERRIAFRVAAPGAYSGIGFDLVTMLGSLRRILDPGRVARHVRGTLDAQGVWMVLEPRLALRRHGEARLRAAIEQGGFATVRRAALRSHDVLLEARP
jgi:2-polyprenyl-3-methyl-5-hydroxy-6-metoxy-1,4-benzoquinol methylase